MIPTKRLYLIFKTHLDMGFTDSAENVLNQYFREFIPAALETARVLRGTGTPFVWTTGAYVIHQFLERGPQELRKKMEDCIRRGEIDWHALPFTSHSELAGTEVFKAGLEFSAELDSRFRVETCAAKATDVPGHTVGVVPFLADAGVRFFHIGINEASHPINLPPLFRWRHPGGKELVVNYQIGYGRETALSGLDAAMLFHHSHDNQGPPSEIEVRTAYAAARERFPDYQVTASGMNEFAREIWEHRGTLPVVTGEMGDTWIHGGATDPLKMAGFRQLSRLAAGWRTRSLDASSRRQVDEFRRRLTLIPEHTWGMDLKTHFIDYLHYEKPAFQKARKRDGIDVQVQRESVDRYVAPAVKVLPEPPWSTESSYSRFEHSWQEQRDYIDDSLEALKTDSLRREAEESLAEAAPTWPNVGDWTPADAGSLYEWGSWKFRFDSVTGAVQELERDFDSAGLIGDAVPLALIEYEVFSQEEYDDFFSKYIDASPGNAWWSLQDYSKCGLRALSDHRYRKFHPVCTGFHVREDHHILSVGVNLRMPHEAAERYGAPRELYLVYRFHEDGTRLETDLHWRRKDASRIPEALWLRFGFNPMKKEGWTLSKLGTQVSPFSVEEYGNRALHAVDAVRYGIGSGDSRVPGFSLINLDSPLVSPGRPRILEFDQEQPDLSEGFAVNLVNNIWGTNFPMWYEDDGFSRFVMEIEKSWINE